jgi:hypothetical protein
VEPFLPQRVQPLEEAVSFGLVLSTSVLLVSIVGCGLAALACGHRSRLWLPIPPAAVAVLAGNAMTWYLLVEVARPRGVP